MVMTEACQHVVGVHDCMPVILKREDWGDWLDCSPVYPEQSRRTAGLLCRPYPELMAVERTAESWIRKGGS